MLNAVIKFALRYRSLIVLGCLVVLGYGSFVAYQLPIDVFPDLDRPRVIVQSECPGLAPEEVESLVTFPIESAMLGANGVQDVRTQSGFGLSVVTIDFAWGTEIKVARQTVQERLATIADDLPNGVQPQMAPISSIMGQFVIAGLRRQPGPHGGVLTSIEQSNTLVERWGPADRPSVSLWNVIDRKNPADWTPVDVTDVEFHEAEADGTQLVQFSMNGTRTSVRIPSDAERARELRTLADWVIRPRLLKISGIAQVVMMGGARKQYQVLIDPLALHEYGVTLAEVDDAIRRSNDNYTGGYTVRDGQEKPIRIIGRLGPRPEQALADLKEIPVKSTADRTILLEQVARIVVGDQLKRGDSSINGIPGVAITVTKQPQTDTRALTDAVKLAFKELEATLPADVIIESGIYELREFIDRGVANVGEALAIGAVLVLIVLFLFLLNIRTTLISLTAIPLSLCITALIFRWIGLWTGTELSINVMTLGGIAVALGELVDDAIVDVENIHRRLRENRLLANPRPTLRVVYEASKEVRTAIVYGTAVVILVFLPLFALSGIEGRLFTPLAIAYIVSILASLLVSLTVTPVLSYYLLGGIKTSHTEREGILLRILKWFARYLVSFSMRFAVPLLLLTWLLVAYCGWRLTTIGADFLPAFDEGTVQIGITLPAGASIEASNEVSVRVDNYLRSHMATPENPRGEILGFLRRSGRAELDEHAEPPNVNEFHVAINPDAGQSRSAILDQLQDELNDVVPGADIEVEQPLAHLISHMISGNTAQIAIKVTGDDLNTLQTLAQKIKESANRVQGVRSLAVEPIRTIDEVHIRLRADALAYYGLHRADVGRYLQTALHGETISQVLEGQRRFDLVLKMDEPYRTDITSLKDLRLELSEGRGSIRLGELAEITPLTGGDSGANQVKRENARRRIVVRCNAGDRDLASVVADLRTTIENEVKLPTGYFIEYGGQFESQQRATRLIAILTAVSIVGMFFVLYLLIPSVRIVLQILNAIPTAFIGGVFALILTEQTLTVASLVGFISLGGIAVRNGILLVTHYQHLLKHEGESFTHSMVLRGSLERLAPVLMTALTAGIGLIPLVFAGQQPGREILYPVATVIFGGLITSTFCEFLIHPGLFWRFSGPSVVQLLSKSDADPLEESDRSIITLQSAAGDVRPDADGEIH